MSMIAKLAHSLENAPNAIQVFIFNQLFLQQQTILVYLPAIWASSSILLLRPAKIVVISQMKLKGSGMIALSAHHPFATSALEAN